VTTDRYEASRGLFATAELLVLFSQHNESYITQKINTQKQAVEYVKDSTTLISSLLAACVKRLAKYF